MIKRFMIVGKVKPGYEQIYIERHKQMWPEMYKLLKKSGYLKVSTFMKGSKFYIYHEVDEEIYNREIANLNNNPETMKWNEFVKDVYDVDYKIEVLDEAFYLE